MIMWTLCQYTTELSLIAENNFLHYNNILVILQTIDNIVDNNPDWFLNNSA